MASSVVSWLAQSQESFIWPAVFAFSGPIQKKNKLLVVRWLTYLPRSKNISPSDFSSSNKGRNSVAALEIRFKRRLACRRPALFSSSAPESGLIFDYYCRHRDCQASRTLLERGRRAERKVKVSKITQSMARERERESHRGSIEQEWITVSEQ